MASLSNPAQVADYSVPINGTAAGTACPFNASRSFLMIQASGTAVFSFTNSTPVSGSAGCYSLTSAMAPLLFSPVVPNSPIYYGAAGSGELIITQG
jgi:hypothetical protein